MSRRLMRDKFQLLFIISTIIIFLFPSISFSKSTTVVGEHCDIYLGDMKNKKELEEIRRSVREYSIKDGLEKLDGKDKGSYIYLVCVRHIISQYLGKVVVVSHTEEGRKICEKVKITLDPEVIIEYLSQEKCMYYIDIQ